MDTFSSSVFYYETGFGCPFDEPPCIVVWHSSITHVLRQRALEATYRAQSICLVSPTADNYVQHHDFMHWSDWSLFVQALNDRIPELPSYSLPLDFQLRASVAAFYTPTHSYQDDYAAYDDAWNDVIPLRKDLLDDRPHWQKSNDPKRSPRKWHNIVIRTSGTVR